MTVRDFIGHFSGKWITGIKKNADKLISRKTRFSQYKCAVYQCQLRMVHGLFMNSMTFYFLSCLKGSLQP